MKSCSNNLRVDANSFSNKPVKLTICSLNNVLVLSQRICWLTMPLICAMSVKNVTSTVRIIAAEPAFRGLATMKSVDDEF